VADDVVRDAERYRFLRDEDTNHLAGVFMVIHMEADGDMHGMQLTPEQADKAIDLAILAAQQQKVKP
jgi:hypothetical protein